MDDSASVINAIGRYVEKRGVTIDKIHGQGAAVCVPLDRRSRREPSG